LVDRGAIAAAPLAPPRAGALAAPAGLAATAQRRTTRLGAKRRRATPRRRRASASWL
jgi:hypothetical protein